MKKTSKLAQCGIIAAIYASLTLALPGIGFGIFQLRLGEAMCVLPLFMPVAAPGLTLGCFVANAVGAAMGITTVWDVLFGTLATAIAAYSTRKIKKLWLAPLPAVISNAIIIGTMLTCIMTGKVFSPTLIWNIALIGLSQLLSCYVLGLPLIRLIKRTKIADLQKKD